MIGNTLFDSYENVSAAKIALIEANVSLSDEGMITRSLRADRGNIGATVQRIKKTLNWRENTVPRPLICRQCAKDHDSHYLHTVGKDKLGRPVIYSVFSLANNMDSVENTQHMIHTFDHAISLMEAPNEKWIWISDFTGFGMKHLNPSTSIAASSLFSTYYPERLGTFLFLGAPKIFSTLYHSITPLLDPVTRSKLTFVPKGTDDQMRQMFSEYFDEELSEWLIKEVKQNADKAKRKEKKYSSAAIKGSKSFSSVEDVPCAQEDAVVSGHNFHGTSSFLKHLQKQPLNWQQSFYHIPPSSSAPDIQVLEASPCCQD